MVPRGWKLQVFGSTLWKGWQEAVSPISCCWRLSNETTGRGEKTTPLLWSLIVILLGTAQKVEDEPLGKKDCKGITAHQD